MQSTLVWKTAHTCDAGSQNPRVTLPMVNSLEKQAYDLTLYVKPCYVVRVFLVSVCVCVCVCILCP